MPTVKAYELDDIIVVKYYDNGQSTLLNCPHCLWSGELRSYPGYGVEYFSELTCPDCKARLGTLTQARKH